MERTLKLHAYSEDEKNKSPQDKQEKERNISLELEKKSMLLEEEKNKSLDLLKTIVQLRESLKQEQSRSAELDTKLTKLNSVEENQLAKKNALLEEEKAKSLDYVKTIEQLKENVKQLETKLAKLNSVEENELARKNAQLEEERAKSLEYVKLIDQLRDDIKQEQAKSEETVNKFDELLIKTKSLSELEARIRDLNGVLNTISKIAAAGADK
jgi:hypothetical protein